MVDNATEKLEAHAVANIFPMMGEEEFAALVEDIKKNGLMEAIWLHDGKIIDGRNRYNACLKAGVKPIFREFNGSGSLVSFVLSLNLKRRHLDKGQKALVALNALPFYEAEAKERQTATLKQGDKLPVTQKIEERDAGEAAEQVGKMFGVNRQYIHEAKKINIEDKNDILSGKKKFVDVVKENKKAERKEKIAAQVDEIKKLQPIKKTEYGVIVIDPPWQFKGEYDPETRRSVGDYPTMSFEEIQNIKLPMAKDCVVWFWGVDIYLKETLALIERMGLERKATLVWIKDKFGLGAWLRNQHEYCFVCVKGKPMFDGKSTSTILNAPRGKHSEKPNEFYVLVEKVCPDPRRLDYFARKKREDWDVYGDEVKQ